MLIGYHIGAFNVIKFTQKLESSHVTSSSACRFSNFAPVPADLNARKATSGIYLSVAEYSKSILF